VPARFVFRFDRRLTIGETPEQAVADVENLSSVAKARAAGLKVEVGVPVYPDASWKGYVLNNPQIYLGWVTPEEHPAIQAAVTAYRNVVSPHVNGKSGTGGSIPKEPRVDRWIFSTDGVGYPVSKNDTSIPVGKAKQWVVSGAYTLPCSASRPASSRTRTKSPSASMFARCGTPSHSWRVSPACSPACADQNFTYYARSHSCPAPPSRSSSPRLTP
jgi:hypothetical protein